MTDLEAGIAQWMTQEQWVRCRPRPKLSGLHPRPHLDPWPVCTSVTCRAPAEVIWAEVRVDPEPPLYQVTEVRCPRCCHTEAVE